MIVLYCTEAHPRFKTVLASISAIDPMWNIVLNPDTKWVDDNFDEIAIVVSIFNNKILTGKILNKVNFNVHASPPWYRGLGGSVFAVLEERDTHGAVAHIIDEKIDHGQIINTFIFNIDACTYEEIIAKTYDCSISLMESILSKYKVLGYIPISSNEKWIGGLKTKHDLFLALDNSPESFSKKIKLHYSKFF